MSTHASAELRMANDIAAQLSHQSHDQAVQTLAEHVMSFWDPRMRSRLLTDLAQPDAATEVTSVVTDAAALIKA